MVVKIRSGGNHHGALTIDGKVYLWGLGVYNCTLW